MEYVDCVMLLRISLYCHILISTQTTERKDDGRLHLPAPQSRSTLHLHGFEQRWHLWGRPHPCHGRKALRLGRRYRHRQVSLKGRGLKLPFLLC